MRVNIFLAGWLAHPYYDYFLTTEGELVKSDKKTLVPIRSEFVVLMEKGEAVPTEAQQVTIDTIKQAFGQENVFLYFPK